MMAVILAGGKGRRLEPFTMTIPKPLLPLDDMPIIEVVIRQLVKAGVKRIVLTLGHMGPVFTSLIGDGSKWGVSIEYQYEEKPLGTSGAISLIDNLDDDFIVMNGDILTTLDYKELFDFHIKNKNMGTIAVTKRNVNIDFGVVELTSDDKLGEYIEKPVISHNVSMGINVLSKEALKYIPEGKKFDMPELMVAIKENKNSVGCYKTDCYWQDIGRFDDYKRASDDFAKDSKRFL